MGSLTFLSPQTYETSFALDENPLSEGGRWIDGLTVGSVWSDMQTSGGRCYGTQTGPVSPPYDDSCAYLQSVAGRAWSPNQEIEARVSITTRSGWTGFHETQLLLRGSLSANSNKCYECLFPCTGNTKLELIQWKGPLGENSGGVSGNPNTFCQFAEQASWPGLENGDWIKATIVGSVITMYHRTNAGSYTAYITFDVINDTPLSGTPVYLSDGMPGLAHWKNGNGNLSDHGFSYWRVKA